MTFLNPLVLLGLLAAAIPLLLHLLNLRKLKTVDFSTLRFIKELQKTQIRKLKLQQILLLILRTLVVVFAVLAFSRPVIQSSLAFIGGHVKTSVIILLDNSFSMDCSDEAGNRLKQARNAAQQICSALKEGDEVALICSEDVGDLRKLSFSRNVQIVSDRLQKLSIAPRCAEMGAMLRMASALMSESSNVNHEVYIISDAQRNIFDDQQDSLRLSFSKSRLYVVPIGVGTKVSGQNLAVDSLNVVSGIFQRDKLIDVEARIRNTGEVDTKGLVVAMTFNGSRVAQRTVDVPAGQVRTLVLSATAQQTGAIRASVEIEGDAVEMDNKRYFSFVIPPPPKVALVGSPESNRFLAAVLAVEAGRELFNLSILSATDVGSANLENYDVVILSSALSRADISRVQSYVRAGGSAFVFAHDNREALSELCSQLSFGELIESRFTSTQAASFISTDKNHPLFQGVFKGGSDGRGVVESPKILRAFAAGGAQSIIAMQGGAFLAESRVGDGRALYCAVPALQGWSNFPLTGIFPTIVFRSIPYLSAREQLGKFCLSGSSLSVMLPKKFKSGGRYKIIDPSGVETLRDAASLPSGSMLPLGQMKQVGVTTISTQNDQPISCVSTNVSASESILQSFTSSEIAEELKKRCIADQEIQLLNANSKLGESVARARIGTELWRLFVVLAILCALAEMIVARYSASHAAGT